MGNFNKWFGMGRLTRDPETRYTQNNTAVCSFSLAINHRYKDQSGEWVDKPTYIDCKIWGKRGEAFAKYHQKGSEAFVTGRLETESWQDKQSGQNRSKVVAVCEEWEFVGGKSEGGQQSRGRASQGSSSDGWTVDGPGDFLGADETPF